MTTFRVWAPAASTVDVEIEGQRHPMTQEGEWCHAEASGTDYLFRLDGGEPLPDPRSLRQPAGVNGYSRSYDHRSFCWNDQAWPGRELYGLLIYELHIGTFTSEGTFDAAIGKLGYLADLGVTAGEVMPV